MALVSISYIGQKLAQLQPYLINVFVNSLLKMFVPRVACSLDSRHRFCLPVLAGLGTVANTALPGATPMAGSSGGPIIRPDMAGIPSGGHINVVGVEMRILCNAS